MNIKNSKIKIILSCVLIVAFIVVVAILLNIKSGKENSNELVVEDATYYDASEDRFLTENEEFPKAELGDIYTTNDYIYECSEVYHIYATEYPGWSVKVKDKTKERYEEFSEDIKVISLNETFAGCTNMKKAPEIPHTVYFMDRTFAGCTSLETIPKISSTHIGSLYYTFEDCTSLEEVPLDFFGSGISFQGTFKGCKNLTTAPIIGIEAKCLYETFSGCTSLTGKIEIKGDCKIYNKCFYGVDFEAQNITIDATLIDIEELKKTTTVTEDRENITEYGDTVKVSWKTECLCESPHCDEPVIIGEIKEFKLDERSKEFTPDIVMEEYNVDWICVNSSVGKKVGETFDMVYEYQNTKVRRAFTILEIKKNVD